VPSGREGGDWSAGRVDEVDMLQRWVSELADVGAKRVGRVSWARRVGLVVLIERL